MCCRLQAVCCVGDVAVLQAVLQAAGCDVAVLQPARRGAAGRAGSAWGCVLCWGRAND